MTRIDVTFPSGGDGCAAWLYRPATTDGDVPCVVMAHGFSGTREDGLAPYAERFAAAGLAVLVFDYRYFGDSGGEPRQLLDIRRQLADWEAGVAFARSLEGIDPERVALFGTSFSGGHVITIAARDPRIAAVVAQCPFVDGLATLRVVPVRNGLRATAVGLLDQLGAFAGRPPRTIPAIGAPGTFAAMTAPEAEPGFSALIGDGSRWRNEIAARVMLHMAQYRPVKKAPDVACPLLVCVCDKDETTPPGPAVRAAELAPRGEAIHYPVGHFEIYRGEPFERAVADQASFLTRHLLGAQSAAAPGFVTSL
jgi:uncharacterized protein